jgi:hypothetical protein
VTALTVERKPRSGRVCSNRCHTASGVRSAVTFISLAGYPYPGKDPENYRRAGWFCQICSLSLQKHYAAALEDIPLGEPEPNVCGCGCGTTVGKRSGWVAGHQAVSWHKGRVVPESAKRRARVAAAVDARRAA